MQERPARSGMLLRCYEARGLRWRYDKLIAPNPPSPPPPPPALRQTAISSEKNVKLCREMPDKRTEKYGSESEWRTFLKIAAILRLIASCPS
ncbi:hypothetical protein F7725_025491 [Xyrichtys novacula]|uniref:Uncharacterized protein n=1 Tax=Xyrichtys novacula TaxID=13765 RepID=A0AAV1HF35_XYRNO|nr:hypothetical protein F7725_025491 [Xyrichtys novacula]